MTAAGVRWFIGVVAAYLAAALAVYWPALRGEYIWDDRDIYILYNPLLWRRDGLWRFWFTADAVDYYPLAYTVYWFGKRLWELNPLGFHATNVVVHALAGTFLAWTLKGLRFPLAVLVGLLFVLHPMNVESVAWIAQLKTCLAGMLAFAAAGCLVRGWWWSSFALFTLSLSSKPTAIAFPIVIFVYFWWLDRRIDGAIWLRSVPFFVSSLIFGVVGICFQYMNAIGPTIIRTDSILTRLTACTWAVWFYAWKALAPVNLMFVYPRWDVSGAGVLGYVPGIALVAIAGLLWIKRMEWGRTPAAVFALYLLMILPSSGLADAYYWRYTFVGDHYAYQALPMVIASAVGIVWMLFRGWGANHATQAVVVGRLAAFVVLALFAVQSLRLSKDYRTEIGLWKATLRRNPDAWLAHTNLASRYFEHGELAPAEPHVVAAYRLRPDLAESHNNRGLLLSRQGRHAEAAACFQAAVDRSPFQSQMWGNLGNELYRLGRNEEALDKFRRAVEIVAQSRWAGPKHVRPLCEYANLLAVMGRRDEALAAFREAGQLRPDEPLVPLGLGHLYAQEGKFREAAAEYYEALALNPGNPDALLHLGRTREKLGDPAAALDSFEQAAPFSTEALLAAVWVRAASPKVELRDPPRALAAVEQVWVAGMYAAMVHDAHAVALAANGRFPDALKANDRALEACRESPIKDVPAIKDAIALLEHRADLYRRGQPYLGPTSEMTPALERQ